MSIFKRTLALLLALIAISSLIPEALAEENYVECVTSYSTAPKASIWKIYKSNLHYFYNQLSGKERQAFSCRYDSIAMGKPNLWPLNGFGLTYDEERRVVYALTYDTPELMLGDSQFSVIKPDISVYIFYATNTYKFIVNDASKLKAHAKKINNYWKKTKTVLDKIKKSKSYGKTAYAHQLALDRYVVKNCKYKLDTKYDRTKINYNRRAAYSVFVNKAAVCEGYARSTMLALRYYGIPCIYVYGYGNGEAHAWNMVKLGKYWYHYDPTWQDGNDKNTGVYTEYMPYFNVTEKFLSRSHTFNKEAKTSYGFNLPSATKTEQEFYTKNKRVLGKDWKNKLLSLLTAAKKNKKKTLGVRFSNVNYYNAAYKYVSSSARTNLWNTLYRKKGFSASFIKKMHYIYDSKSLLLYFFWK